MAQETGPQTKQNESAFKPQKAPDDVDPDMEYVVACNLDSDTSVGHNNPSNSFEATSGKPPAECPSKV